MSPTITALPSRRAETVSERVRRLQTEARQLAGEHVKELKDAMSDLQRLAGEIAAGGDAYAPGIRDVARRLVEDMESRVQTIEAINARGVG